MTFQFRSLKNHSPYIKHLLIDMFNRIGLLVEGDFPFCQNMGKLTLTFKGAGDASLTKKRYVEWINYLNI